MEKLNYLQQFVSFEQDCHLSIYTIPSFYYRLGQPLPCPVRPPLNLQPIETCPLPEYNDEPPPPYIDETRQEVILQYKYTSILFKIGEKKFLMLVNLLCN